MGLESSTLPGMVPSQQNALDHIRHRGLILLRQGPPNILLSTYSYSATFGLMREPSVFSWNSLCAAQRGNKSPRTYHIFSSDSYEYCSARNFIKMRISHISTSACEDKYTYRWTTIVSIAYATSKDIRQLPSRTIRSSQQQ